MLDDENQPQESEIEPQPGAEGAPETAEPTAEQLVDLDTLEKFKFGGREYTREKFNSERMMQSDYTKKTQEIAKERKYFENLRHDLDQVKANPDLIAEFKRIYPEKFHSYLEYVQERKDAAAAKSGQPRSALDPDVERRISAMESRHQEQERQATQSDVDANCNMMSKKYPDVPEPFAIAELEGILARKRQDEPGAKLTPQDYEKAWKAVDDSLGKISKARYSKIVNEQKTASQKGKDVASGGGIPGQAPRAAKTIREATDLALRDMQNS